jgi:hypothetical protein
MKLHKGGRNDVATP